MERKGHCELMATNISIEELKEMLGHDDGWAWLCSVRLAAMLGYD